MRRGRCRRAGEEQAAEVTVQLARAVRLLGISRSADAEATRTNHSFQPTKSCGGEGEESVAAEF
jgi:hypothetical protein